MADDLDLHTGAPLGTRRQRRPALRITREQLAVARSFIFKTLITTLVLALVLPVLPGLVVHGASVWTYLAIGVTLSVLNSMLKPLLLVFNGHLILWHTLAWQALINMVVLFLAFLLSQVQATFTELHWLIVDALLISLVLTLADAVLGFDRPRVTPGNEDRAIWQFADRFPGLRRSKQLKKLRLAQVYGIVWDYGLEIAVGRTPFRRLRARTTRWITGHASPLDSMSVPQKVCHMLERLGPLYVKLGQIVSSQAASLPDEWRVELNKLQSTVKPFPYHEARTILVEGLGAPPEKLFGSFERQTLAAASTAQVHRATLPDGTEVVVKVQRPNIVAKVWIDLQIMGDLASRLERRFGWARELDLSAIVQAYAAGVIRELDYRNEAYHGVRLAANMASLGGVHVPTIYRELSSARVLTMEWIQGVTISRLAAQPSDGVNRDELLRLMVRAIVKQLLIDGFFHADPHPGNLCVDVKTSTITFLDLGMMGELNGEQRSALLELLFALQEQDTNALADVLRRLSRESRPLMELEFRAAIQRVFLQEWVYAVEPGFTGLMTAILSELSRHGLRLNENLTLALKAMMQAEAAVRLLSPQSDVFAMISDESRRLLGEQWAPARIVDAVENQLRKSGGELLRRLPALTDATMRWLDTYQRGSVSVDLTTGELPQRIGSLTTILSSGFRQLAVGLALCGMVIGSAVTVGLMRSPTGDGWSDVTGYALAGFLGVLSFSGVIVVRLLRGSAEPDGSKGV